MTQIIFKKSNKQDMIDLFNILPDWVNYITNNKCKLSIISAELPKITTHGRLYGIRSKHEPTQLNIDFETDKIEEMIIKRPTKE